MNIDSEEHPCLETLVRNEVPPLSQQLKVKSDNDGSIQEMETKVEIKQELCSLEGATEMISEGACTSDVHVKSELVSSSFLVQSDSHLCNNYHEMDTKIEIKEEPLCIQRTPNGSEDLNFDPEDNVSEDLLLTESTRLGVEAIWNVHSDATSTYLDMGSLKLRKNEGCKEKLNTTAAQEEVINDRISHKCKLCNKSFGNLSHLKKHTIFMHKLRKLHKCEICMQSFTRESGLNKHYLTHNGKKEHNCEICGKNVINAASLKQHKCEICERSFTNVSVHDVKKPFECKRCGKNFSWTSFKQHNLIHQGKKPHQCQICERSFRQASHLKKHVTQDGKKLYICEICGKTFTHVSSLKPHKLIHEGQRPYNCEICSRNFTYASKLKRHNSVHHCKKTI